MSDTQTAAAIVRRAYLGDILRVGRACLVVGLLGCRAGGPSRDTKPPVAEPRSLAGVSSALTAGAALFPEPTGSPAPHHEVSPHREPLSAAPPICSPSLALQDTVRLLVRDSWILLADQPFAPCPDGLAEPVRDPSLRRCLEAIRAGELHVDVPGDLAVTKLTPILEAAREARYRAWSLRVGDQTFGPFWILTEPPDLELTSMVCAPETDAREWIEYRRSAAGSAGARVFFTVDHGCTAQKLTPVLALLARRGLRVGWHFGPY